MPSGIDLAKWIFGLKMAHGLKGWDTDLKGFFPRRVNGDADWADEADLRGFSRFRVDLLFCKWNKFDPYQL